MRMFCFALGAIVLSTLSPRAVDARPITLPEALAAVEGSPTLAVAASDVEAAAGNADQAGTYTYNPTVSVAAGPAFGMGMRVYDMQASIAQVIELGGKRSKRRRVAIAESDAATERLAAARNELVAEVRRAFLVALVAQSRVVVTTDNEVAARELQAAAQERVRVGAATQTEVNVAVAGLGRAIAAKKAAERDLLLARQALGDALGVVGTDLDPVGIIPTFPAPPTDEQALVTAALSARRDLVAAERTRAARAADVDLANAQATPDPELSVTWSRDAIDQANAFVGGISLALPLWNRNQGNRRAARAALKRAGIELDALRREVERDVRTAARRYRSATDAVASFDEQVVGTLAENLKLARETLAAGKLGLLELNAVRRDLVDSQLAYLDTLVEATEARAALETATGQSLGGTP